MPQFIAALDSIRELKKQATVIETEMKSFKTKVIQPHVEANGKFKDDTGYARMQNGGGGFKVDSKAINTTAVIWSESDDPTLQSCGKQILSVMEVKEKYQYLAVK